MYDFVLMAADKSAPANAGDLLEKIGIVTKEAQGRYVVEGRNRREDGWICISRNDEAWRDLEEAEILEISTRLGVPISDVHFFSVQGGLGQNAYHDIFLSSLAANENYLINNLHGCIADVAVYRGKLAKGIEWLYSAC
jgi:hypothetical protein